MSIDHQTLQVLVDEGRVEELLRLVSVTQVTQTWLRYHGARSHPDDPDVDPDWWAVELWMSKAWWADDQRVKDGIMALVQAAEDDLLSTVAAGPLEVFVSNDESRLAWIEQQALQSETFRRALAQVWAWDLPSKTFARLEQAAQTRLPRPEH